MTESLICGPSTRWFMDSHSNRYRRSTALLERALKTIPLGSQTFSKSHISYPQGQAPLFLTHGKGAHVWDVDGNEYIDLVNGLLPVVLGYGDPDVDAAVTRQMEKGVTFSLAVEHEIELAEKLVELIPCAEMVRFGKNGSDATAGAIRLARAHTGRDRVAVCGYHGWQDWYIGSTARHVGVPDAVRSLTHTFVYNDLESLDRLLTSHPGEFAAVIMEPMTMVEPVCGYLAGVKDMAHANGAVLVFDEIITGFRFDIGGLQAQCGVVPDLATFGKSMANGYPISAVVGRADIMKGMEEIFFSFTFGGEALSLAAALATIEKMQCEPVLETIRLRGTALRDGLSELITHHEVGSFVSVTGRPEWSMIVIDDVEDTTSWEIKTLFLQEMLARGVLILGSHNVSYSLDEDDLNTVLSAYDEVLGILSSAWKNNDFRNRLHSPPLEPLFRVRG